MKYTIALLMLFFSITSFADSKCPQLYPHGQPIVVKDTIELCNIEYVAIYDPIMKANIFSAERFEANHPHQARVDAFAHDLRLNPNQRAELQDYMHSEYDRGHMAPAADMGTAKEMEESFLLSNMTPQASKLNRGVWKLLEEHVRATTEGATHVITGAIYGTNYKTLGKNKIPIPNSYYKCVWYTEIKVECFTANNASDAKIIPISPAKIQSLVPYPLK